MLKLSAILLLVVVACAAERVYPNDKELAKLSYFATKYRSERDPGPFHYRLLKTTNAAEKERVEDGYKYRITLLLGVSKCKKKDMSFEESLNCDTDYGRRFMECTFTMLEDEASPIDGDYKMLHSICRRAKDSDEDY